MDELIRFSGDLVPQWVKRWPAVLAAPEFEYHSRRNLLNRKRGSIAHSLSLSSSHRPDMAKILLKIESHPSIRPSIHPSIRFSGERYRAILVLLYSTFTRCHKMLAEQILTYSANPDQPDSVLQIRRGNRDNLGIISHISP